MTDSLVSVLVPAYNHENYIQETINSIIEQEYENIELIVIDDGSKDSTFQKMKEQEEICRKRFKNIYFETKENEGLSKTVGRLLSLAKGDYVFIIASDDTVKPNAIKEEVEFLDKNPDFALCVGNCEFIDENSKVCFWDEEQNTVYDKNAPHKDFASFLQKFNKIKFNSKEFGKYKTFYLKNYIPNGYLIRKSIYEKTGDYTKEAPLEDWWLMLQISKYAKMKYIDKIFFSYRVHSTNTIRNFDRMKKLADKTFAYENEVILPDLDFTKVFDNVAEVYKNGVLDKRQGIPFIFEILTFIKYKKKIKRIKLFNIKIFEYEKGSK